MTLALRQLGGGRGLGAEASPYKCNSTICYGADGGATHALFKETQFQLNRAGKALFGTGWAAVQVDGFIGEKTRIAYNRVAPKIPALVGAKYVNAPYFSTVAQWVSQSRPFIPDALKRAADQKTGQAENPAVTEVRTQSYASEGPAKSGSSSMQPGVVYPTPGANLPATTQPTPNAPGAPGTPKAGMSTGAKAFVAVTAVVAVVGLVATASYVAKKRRRG